MNRRGLIFLSLLLLTSLITSVVFGADFFMFDQEKNNLLHKGPNDSMFVGKVSMGNAPDIMVPTADSKYFVALDLPDTKDSREHGKLSLINLESGKVEDHLDLGYPPYQKVMSGDRKHLLISYRVQPGKDEYEILHYCIPVKRSEKLKVGFLRNIDIASDSKTAFAIECGIDGIGKVHVITLTPFSIKNTITTEYLPRRVYALGNNRAALLKLPGNERIIRSDEKVDGSVKIIDLTTGSILQTVTFSATQIAYEWYPGQKDLLIMTRDSKLNYNGSWDIFWTGKGSFIRVNCDGAKEIDTSLWWDYEYLFEKDELYILTDSKLEAYKLKTDQKSILKSGVNWYNEIFLKNGTSCITTLNYFVDVLDEANLVTVYSNYNGVVKFFDRNTGKLLQTVKSAKLKGAYPADLGNKASVAVNDDHSKYYILNRVRKGLTVFDAKFKEIATIDLSGEIPIGLYQIKKPVSQIVLATEKGLYKVEDKGLKSISQFTEKIKWVYMLQLDNSVIFVSNNSWYSMDTTTFEIRDYLDLLGDSDGQHSGRRYKFIPTFDELSD